MGVLFGAIIMVQKRELTIKLIVSILLLYKRTISFIFTQKLVNLSSANMTTNMSKSKSVDNGLNVEISLRDQLQNLTAQYETLAAQYQTLELEKKEYEKDVCDYIITLLIIRGNE